MRHPRLRRGAAVAATVATLALFVVTLGRSGHGAVAAASAVVTSAAPAWRGQLSARRRPRAGCRRCGVGGEPCVIGKATATAVEEVVTDEWRAEATRCWGVANEGEVPGYIAEMVKPGFSYDPDAADAAAAAEKDLPWRRLEGKRTGEWKAPVLRTPEDNLIFYYSGKHATDTPDVCAKDYSMAMQFFLDLTDEKDKEKGVVPSSEGGVTPRSAGVALDLCCGDGLMARRFAQSGRFGQVFGLDISRQVLRMAKRAAEEERTNPEDGLFLARADVQALPFRDGEVDVAWWGLGMHMTRDPELALKEIFRVLRPGGRLLATTLSANFMPEQIAKLATDAGFEEIGLRVPRYSIFALLAVKPT